MSRFRRRYPAAMTLLRLCAAGDCRPADLPPSLIAAANRHALEIGPMVRLRLAEEARAPALPRPLARPKVSRP